MWRCQPVPGQRIVATVSGHGSGLAASHARELVVAIGARDRAGAAPSARVVRGRRRTAATRPRPLVVCSGCRPSSSSTPTRSWWVGPSGRSSLPEVAPGRRPRRHRMAGRDLDDHGQPGVLGEREHERDHVGDVVQHVVAHHHVGDRRRRRRSSGQRAVHRATGDACRGTSAATNSSSIAPLRSTPISSLAGGANDSDERPPPHPTSSTVPPTERQHLARPSRRRRIGDRACRRRRTAACRGPTATRAPDRGSLAGGPTRLSCSAHRRLRIGPSVTPSASTRTGKHPRSADLALAPRDVTRELEPREALARTLRPPPRTSSRARLEPMQRWMPSPNAA